MSFSPRISDRLQTRARLWLQVLALSACWVVPAFGHGALHERIENLTKRIESQREDVRLHFELADVYCQHGDWAEALVEVERVESLAPKKYPTAVIKAEALLGTANPAEARNALDDFLRSNSADAKALFLRAKALTTLGHAEAALADYRLALSVGKPSVEWAQEAAEAFSAKGQNDEALVILNQAIAKLGEIPSLVMSAMKLEIASDRFDAALRRVDVLQKNAVQPESWMAKRARLLERAGRTDEARVEWEALQVHLAGLPNLKRGTPLMTELAGEAERALRALAKPSVPTALVDKDVRL